MSSLFYAAELSEITLLFFIPHAICVQRYGFFARYARKKGLFFDTPPINSKISDHHRR